MFCSLQEKLTPLVDFLVFLFDWVVQSIYRYPHLHAVRTYMRTRERSYLTDFVLGRSREQISAQRPVILTDVLFVLNTILGYYIKLGHDRFLTSPFQFDNH
jgi:hypothetical protein